MADEEQVKDAAAAYVYGYPLVYDLQEVANFVVGGGSLPFHAPYNTFASARRLLGPETKFVSPNNDTLYVGAQCDVRQVPLLHVPDATTATTCSSSSTPGPTTSPTSGGAPEVAGVPQPDPQVREELGWWERFRVALAAFPPPAARAGLWGNHGYEADYAFAWTDSDGQPLDGANRYQLRLPSPPPVDAFWSLTIYDVPDFYLVANAIDRYSIGDRTPDLQTGPDGSVTIYLQADSPGPGREANWLPPRPGPSGRSCACTSPSSRSWTAPMSCP